MHERNHFDMVRVSDGMSFRVEKRANSIIAVYPRDRSRMWITSGGYGETKESQASKPLIEREPLPAGDSCR